MKFSQLMYDNGALINPKDLEIVFAGVSSCDLYVTSDRKIRNEFLTLGDNHTTSLVIIQSSSGLDLTGKLKLVLDDYAEYRTVNLEY